MNLEATLNLQHSASFQVLHKFLVSFKMALLNISCTMSQEPDHHVLFLFCGMCSSTNSTIYSQPFPQTCSDEYLILLSF